MSTDPIDNLLRATKYMLGRYGHRPSVSEEARAFKRRQADPITVHPSEEDWVEYRAGVELLDKLDQNRFFHVWGHDCEIEMREPEPYTVPGEYLETEDEWLTRVGHLLTERDGDLPDDVDRVLSQGEFFAVVQTFLPNGYGVATEALENFPETTSSPSATSSSASSTGRSTGPHLQHRPTSGKKAGDDPS